MSDKYFVDTNVLIYAYDTQDEIKHQIANFYRFSIVEWDVRRLVKVSGHPPFPARERRNLKILYFSTTDKICCTRFLSTYKPANTTPHCVFSKAKLSTLLSSYS